MCPVHINLRPLSFDSRSHIPMVSLVALFLILSNSVFLKENRSNLRSATSIFPSCPFVSATASIPYSMAGLTMVSYNLPFSFGGTFLSHNTPVIFRQTLQPAWILLPNSLSDPPSLYCGTKVFEL